MPEWRSLCRSRTLCWVCAGVATAAVLALGFTLFRATRALRQAGDETAALNEIPFHAGRLSSGNTPFEPVSAPAVFRDAVEFQGKLYLCGPAGLIAYDSTGSVSARYAAGADLPAPAVAVAIGVAADSSESELFIATAGEGLVAFDGRGFRQVRPDNAAQRDLTSVLPLATGRILFGTEKSGVLVYDGKRITRFHSALSNLEVTALAGDDSSVWAGTVNNGLLHWHAGQVDRFSEAEGLPDPRVLAIALAGDAAYAGTPMGVAEFAGGRLTRVLAEGVFAQSLLVRGDRLVIGTLEEGVVEVPLAAGRLRPARHVAAPLAAPIERLLAIGDTLYAVSAGGLYRNAVRGGFERVLDRGAAVLADRNISALAFDSAGRLWTGYFDRGLDILEPGLDRATHHENGHVFCVNRIVHDAQRGVTAVATANGLVLFDAAGRERQVLGRDQGLIANQVTDVLVSPGGMTVATPAGITFLDDTGARSLYAFHGLVNNHVYTLAADGSRLLAGTLGGLSVIESGLVRAGYTTANSGLKHNWITAIARTGEDSLIGTYGAGVLRWDSAGRWHVFPDLNVPFEVNPNAMLVTSRAVYAGSLSRGVYIYDLASGRWHNVRAGLPSANVTALAEHGGYIYAGTDNGLVRFREDIP
jgi:ligand-binding sensor domain-containing protein